jgi:hypothetical protein
LEKIVFAEATIAVVGGIAGGAACGTGQTESAVDGSPVVAVGAGEAVGGVGAGLAAGGAGVADVVPFVETGEALLAETVVINLEAPGTDYAAAGVEEGIGVGDLCAIGAGELCALCFGAAAGTGTVYA